MFISYKVDTPFIFIHVPRTGGTSIRKVLDIEYKKVPSHVPLFALQGENRFSFGFVRNPWERMVSLYFYMRQKKPDGTFDQDKVLNMSFKEWLVDYNYFPRFDGEPPGSSWGLKRILPLQRRSQMFWLEGCKYIGRFERLVEDLKAASVLGNFKYKEPPIINSSKHEYYRVYYDNETKEFIDHYYEKDIDKFDYKF